MADEPGPGSLPPEADLDAVRRVAERGAFGECPACKKDSPRSIESASMGEHKVILVICDNCGFVAHHAPDFIDRIKISQPDNG